MPTTIHPSETIGYVVPWIASAGNTIDVKVSSTESALRYRVVRLIHGPQGLDFSGQQQEAVTDIPPGTFNGRYQAAYPGSYGIVNNWAYTVNSTGLEVTLHFQPFLLDVNHTQAIFSTLDVSSKAGFAAVLTQNNALEFWIGNGTTVDVVSTGFKPALKRWIKLCFSIQGANISYKISPKSCMPETVEPPIDGCKLLDQHANLDIPCPFLFAATFAETPCQHSAIPTNFFNGRLDSPTVTTAGSKKTLLAQWDFSREISSDRIIDVANASGQGELVNAPTRAVTGHDWDGVESDWTKARYGYGAIHFHEDDLDDARWDTDVSITLPMSLRSGVYAVQIRTADGRDQDVIPFYVRPVGSTGSGTAAKVAYIVSTFTYLAYANEYGTLMPPNWEIRRDKYASTIERRQDIGLSCYHVHKDGSGVIYSTAKRPILNMRPDYINWLSYKPTGLSADLIGLQFLERSGVLYDVICDHDLHHNVGELELSSYGTIITGSHPEYQTTESLRSFRTYISGGGNVMYLGGNGFYWSCAIDISRPHRIEIRRGDQGCRPFTQHGGERLFSTTGQQGLLWRSRGIASNYLLGVGCCACGLGPGVPYRRTEASKSAEFSWMFNGISDNQLIGINGFAGGASGAEIDKCDYSLGSPLNTIIVATSIGHPDLYAILPEEADFPMLKTIGTQTDEIRSDITYYESGGGGAVFSVGSINWLCSLGWNNFDNEVARLTSNVLEEFVRRCQ